MPPIVKWSTITTPLRSEAWAEALRCHPDQRLCNYILSGLQSGFQLGFDHSFPLQSAQANMQSALQNPQPVKDYLAKQCAANRALGPLPISLASSCHISRFGVIPKYRQTGKWRLILDLSFSTGRSINDGIPWELCSLQFATVDNAARLITQLGKGALLAKVDISHAYWNIPVHPDDRRLLGMSWEGAMFVHTTLPFGLRSTLKIFCAVSDTLEWVLYKVGVSSCLHYIDDFLTVGDPSSDQCGQNLGLLRAVCQRLGVPLAAENIEGPSPVLMFLGIEPDTEHMIMCLPRDKLDHQSSFALARQEGCHQTRNALTDWGASTHLQGSPGWQDLPTPHHRCGSLSCKTPPLDLPKRGISNAPRFFTVFTDASGLWGCCAVWDPHWLQVPWSNPWLSTNIAAKELVAVVLALVVWSKERANSHVLVHCDNMAVVEAIKAESTAKAYHSVQCMYLHQLLHSSRTHIAASRSGDTHSVRSRTGPDTGALNYQELLIRQSDISM